MNRTDGLAYLKDEYQELSTEAGLSQDAELKAYGTVIDQSLRQLGFTEDQLGVATLTPNEVVPFLALLDYFALSRFARIFSTRMDVQLSSAINAARSQVYKQVKELLDKAEARLSGLGVSPVDMLTVGRLNLDFLEPEMEGVG